MNPSDWPAHRKAIAIFVGIAMALAAMDYTVGHRQDRYIEKKKELRKKLERLTWYLERTSIARIDFLGKQDLYEAKLKYENIRPEEEMWIMVPEVKVFVQVGTLWKLVPQKTVFSLNTYAVDRLKDGAKVVTTRFAMPYKDYEELFKGYMHFKVESISYILATSVSADDIMEKDEEKFIYVSSRKQKGRLHTLLQ